MRGETCKACSGWGRVTRTLICSTCTGSGFNAHDDSWATRLPPIVRERERRMTRTPCDHCRGTGYVDVALPCPVCKGAGRR
jgi:DnaJ-class molecular chaperone